MSAFNEFFKGLAEKIFPTVDFFKGTTLIFNNLFLVLFTLVCLIALLLVIFLVPSKKKKAAKAVSEEVIDAEDEQKAVEEPILEEQIPVEQAPVEEPVQEEAEEPAPEVVEEPAPEEVQEEAVEEPAEEVVDEPAPEVAEEPAEEPAEEVAEEVVEEVVEEPVEEPVEEVAEEPAEEPAPEAAEEAQEGAVDDEPYDEGLVDVNEVDEDVAEEPIEEFIPDEPAGKAADAKKSGGKYEIVKRNGAFYFILKANNGQLLLESSAYTSEGGAKKAVETFKNAVKVGVFAIDVDKNGNFKFILRQSPRSQMHYHGETYRTRKSAESAIESVKRFALNSVVKRMEANDEVEDTTMAIHVETRPLLPEENKKGGKYEIEKRGSSYYFILKANNGQLLLESMAFTSEAGAKGGIETFKKAADTGFFVVDEDKKGKFRFILRASSRSHTRYFGESYNTRQSAENSVHSVRAFAQNAVLKNN